MTPLSIAVVAEWLWCNIVYYWCGDQSSSSARSRRCHGNIISSSQGFIGGRALLHWRSQSFHSYLETGYLQFSLLYRKNYVKLWIFIFVDCFDIVS